MRACAKNTWTGVRHVAMTMSIALGSLSSSVSAQDVRDDDRSLTMSFTYIGEAAGNTHGGLRQDLAYAGRLLFRSEFDLDRLAGITGGAVRVWLTNRQGRNLADDALGTGTGVQEIYSPQTSHLSVLTYQQQMLGGRLEIEAGRLPANLNFLGSPLCAYLQTNSAC